MGKSTHGVSTTSGDLRGCDADGFGNHDDVANQEQSGERRTVAHSGPTIQKRQIGGQTAKRQRPGTRQPYASVAPGKARVQDVVVRWWRFEREHPERDIEIVSAQSVPVGAQQDLQRVEQHGQRDVRRRIATAAASAEHGQVAVGERDCPVTDIAGRVECVAVRLQVVVSAVPDASGPDVCAKLRRGSDPGRSHQARVPGG